MKKAFMVAARLLCLLSLLGFVGIAPEAVAATETGWAVKWDKLVTAAKKEGTLLLYATAWTPESRIALTEAFKKKYGINIEFSSFSRGAELAAKYSTERNAGLRTVDVFGAGAPTLTTLLKPKGFYLLWSLYSFFLR